MGKIFKEKQREWEKKKDLEEKKKKEFLFDLEKRKRDRDHRFCVDFAEGKSISLEAEEHLSKSGSFKVRF